MHMLDRDHDRRLDFTEFLLMVFKVAMACNKVLSREYCKASGSKKHRCGHQHQEESETEEEEEETPRQKSGCRHSSWREGEEHGYGSGGSRGTAKHRHRSNPRRLGRQGELSSSEGSETSHHGSSYGHSWSSGKERHGSSSGGLGERRSKSHGSPSRESDLEVKEINLAITSQIVNQEVVEDTVMDVSQEVIPLAVLNLSQPPVGTLLVRKDMDIDNVVSHRTVEDNRE
ncbi:filaggrin-2 [Erethizon dorsatum]